MTRIGLVLLIAVLGSPAFGYAQSEAKQTPVEQVRIRTKHANIQAGPQSGADVLVLAPRGTVLKVLERKGPWVSVELTPELRKTATPMRWYKNESRPFHTSVT